MNPAPLLANWIVLLLLSLPVAAATPTPDKPSAHRTQTLAGWTVRIDQRLPSDDPALQLLNARLVALAAVVPTPTLRLLRTLPIQLDLTHGDLKPMQYHPSADWLRENGYSTNLARCVHIPDARYFASPYEAFRQPMAILHELAHAYHDQVLGFDHPEILAAWNGFRGSGRHENVLMITGERRRHYALTDAKEFFAEMSESYFGTNDFYPFVAGELEKDEPEVFALMKKIWGPLPGR